jgi:hypothetical protein
LVILCMLYVIYVISYPMWLGPPPCPHMLT